MNIKRGFYEIAGIPGCLGNYVHTCSLCSANKYSCAGAIDGTAIAILAPSRYDPRFVDGNYYCHKGYHALNVLGVRLRASIAM